MEGAVDGVVRKADAVGGEDERLQCANATVFAGDTQRI